MDITDKQGIETLTLMLQSKNKEDALLAIGILECTDYTNIPITTARSFLWILGIIWWDSDNYTVGSIPHKLLNCCELICKRYRLNLTEEISYANQRRESIST